MYVTSHVVAMPGDRIGWYQSEASIPFDMSEGDDSPLVKRAYGPLLDEGSILSWSHEGNISTKKTLTQNVCFTQKMGRSLRFWGHTSTAPHNPPTCHH